MNIEILYQLLGMEKYEGRPHPKARVIKTLVSGHEREAMRWITGLRNSSKYVAYYDGDSLYIVERNKPDLKLIKGRS